MERLSQFHNSAAFITDMNALQHSNFCADRLLASDSRTKRVDLLAAAETTSDSDYTALHPDAAVGLPFMPVQVEEVYLSWPLLIELLPKSYPGVKTSRDPVVVDIDRIRLEERVQRYLDPAVTNEEMAQIAPLTMVSTERFNAATARQRVLNRGPVKHRVVRYAYRPFDTRWLYWEEEPGLLDRNRADYIDHIFPGNVWIEARERQPMDAFDRGAVVRDLGDNLGNGLSSYIPLYIATSADSEQTRLFGSAEVTGPEHNVSARARAYIDGIGASPEDFFFHAVAILNTPKYRRQNAGALRLDWPRIPLPRERSAFCLLTHKKTADATINKRTLGQNV